MSKTLNDVAQAAPDSYIEGGFVATVTKPASRQTKTGKTMFKAILTDGNLEVDATSFSQTFDHWDGKRVVFYGQGLKRGADYNGKAQVTLGDRVKVTVEGGAATPNPPSPAPSPAPQDAPRGRTFQQRMDDYGLFFAHCYARANDFATQRGIEADVEGVRNIATTFFIQGQKDGLHVNPPAL